MFRKLWQRLMGSKRRSRLSTAVRTRLRLEALEDRWMPSATAAPALPTIAGFVYADTNHNGIMDSGETGVAGQTVELHRAIGDLVATTLTGPNGHYLFDSDPTINVTPQTKTVAATFTDQATDWTQTQDLAQFDPSLGTLTSVEIFSDADLTTDVKVENAEDHQSSVECDVNGSFTLSGAGFDPLQGKVTIQNGTTLGASDGVFDFMGPDSNDFGNRTGSASTSVDLKATEHDLSAFIGTGTIQLTESANVTSTDSGSGNFDQRIRSDANGQVRIVYHYMPGTPLEPGDYFVKKTTTPPGFVDGQTTSDNVTPIPNSMGVNQIAVHLDPNSQSLSNNFAEIPPSSLAGEVFHDLNDNGALDPTDAPIAGVTVTLTGQDFLGNGVSQTQQTDANGAYKFDNLLAGSYTITETEPSGFLHRIDLAGSQGGTASGSGAITQITLGAGIAGLRNDFGEVKAASLSGSVYADANNNGVKDPGEAGLGGVTLTLSGTDDLGKSVSSSTTSAGDGSYSFANLRPGSYTVTETTQPAGFIEGKDTAGNLGGTAKPGVLSAIPLPSAGAGVNYNFGHIQPGSLAGFVYNDVNADGIKQPAEAGMPTVPVVLTGTDDSGNAVSLSTTTASDGSYSFGSLRPGSYTISDTTPPGFTPTKATPGSLGGTSVSDQLFVSLGLAENGINYNFGVNQLPLPPLPPLPPPPIVPHVIPNVPPPPPPMVINKGLFFGNDFFVLLGM
jgi:uncharacterized protein (DUF2141 family)